jgi:hypothetical protein
MSGLGGDHGASVRRVASHFDLRCLCTAASCPRRRRDSQAVDCDLERSVGAAATTQCGSGRPLPRRLRRRPIRLAIDVTEIPYHGRYHEDRHEICRRQPRSGTSHFHCYATAFAIERGERLTFALTAVREQDSKKDIVQRLLRQVRSKGVRIKYVLLDRGFYAIDVIRYLQAARCAFIMPVVHCGGRAKDPRHSRSTNRFLTWTRSGRSTHTLSNKTRSATVRIAVACDQWGGRKGKQGRRVLVFADWGFRERAPAWVREEYRRRFGIETSYRQMHQARIRTSSRRPLIRLLLVGLALILRNLWVWLHRTYLAQPLPGGHIRVQLWRLRFRALLLMLQRAAETDLGSSELDQPQSLNHQPLPQPTT